MLRELNLGCSLALSWKPLSTGLAPPCEGAAPFFYLTANHRPDETGAAALLSRIPPSGAPAARYETGKTPALRYETTGANRRRELRKPAAVMPALRYETFRRHAGIAKARRRRCRPCVTKPSALATGPRCEATPERVTECPQCRSSRPPSSLKTPQKFSWTVRTPGTSWRRIGVQALTPHVSIRGLTNRGRLHENKTENSDPSGIPWTGCAVAGQGLNLS